MSWLQLLGVVGQIILFLLERFSKGKSDPKVTDRKKALREAVGEKNAKEVKRILSDAIADIDKYRRMPKED